MRCARCATASQHTSLAGRFARIALALCAILASVIAAACTSGGAPRADTTAVNTLSAGERAEGWRLLFDGTTTSGWRAYGGGPVPSGWQVMDGALVRAGAGAGDIITTGKFRNFVLDAEWKVAPGGNSGIFYRASDEHQYVWQSALEMQVLDDAGHSDGRAELTSAGSLFALYPAPRGVVRPAGEWNRARVVMNGNRGEHWLNGMKLFDFEIGSADWDARIRASKFATMPGFARESEGYIGLQDHGDHVEFRNIKIRALP
jgi:hypothetical protein